MEIFSIGAAAHDDDDASPTPWLWTGTSAVAEVELSFPTTAEEVVPSFSAARQGVESEEAASWRKIE